MCKERASDESGGFEDDPERIRQELLPGPAPPPDDPATALQTIDDWNETWVSICDTQDTNRIVLSKELREFIEETKYLARWCESAGLDSSPLLEYAHNAWDTYYGFRPTLPERCKVTATKSGAGVRCSHQIWSEGMIEGFSLGNYLLLVEYTGRLFRAGKAVISGEMAGVFERLGSNAENWQARLQKLAAGRLLGRFFAASRARLREVAERLGVHHLANLGGCAAR